MSDFINPVQTLNELFTKSFLMSLFLFRLNYFIFVKSVDHFRPTSHRTLKNV